MSRSKAIKDLIDPSLIRQAERAIEQLECNHSWVERGAGYNCISCNYHVGCCPGNINKIIEVMLKDGE